MSPSLAVFHASGLYERKSVLLTRSDLELKNIQESKIKKQGSVNSVTLLKADLKDCLNCNTTLMFYSLLYVSAVLIYFKTAFF